MNTYVDQVQVSIRRVRDLCDEALEHVISWPEFKYRMKLTMNYESKALKVVAKRRRSGEDRIWLWIVVPLVIGLAIGFLIKFLIDTCGTAGPNW